MTAAVCIRCGAMKIGALTVCRECRFDPATAVDKAKSIVLSDRYLSHDDLDGIATRIRNNEPVGYPEDEVENLAEMIEEEQARTARAGKHLGRIALAVVLAAVAILLLIYLW